MKDFMMIWNRFAGRRYSTVNVNNTVQSESSETEEITITRRPGSITRKSSVVVNRLFNTALPGHSDEKQRWPKSILMLTTLGLLALLSGCMILVIQPYDLLFKLKVLFSEGGEIFELWRKPPVDLYLKVFLFNVTNRDEYMSGAEAKLRFEQIGPYVYKETLEHGNIKFNDNGTITAVPYHPLIYVPEMSNGTEEDIMILPNIALLSITSVMRDASYFTRLGLNLLIRQTDTQPLVQMTAREFMFGYESTLVTLGNNIMPSWIKFDKLGLIDRMYDFEGDYETIYSGKSDIHLTGLIEKYNGDTNLPHWTGKCANVQGASDGTKFPSYIEPNDTLLFFRKSLCRSAHMVRTGEKVIKGLHSYQYKFKDNELDNGAFNPENKCFCRHGHCLKPGLIDVTDCYYGFPIALSYPHFYKAHPSLLEAVEGLHPNKEKHESYFYIQPQSGLPVALAFRFQINLFLENIGHMARVEKFENFVLPLLWFEIGMYELPTSMNSRFWLYINAMPVVQDAIMYLFFLSGASFLIWGLHKVFLYGPKGSISTRDWLDVEMEKNFPKCLNSRRPSNKTKEMETYYSSLLGTKEEEAISPMSKDMVSLNEDIV